MKIFLKSIFALILFTIPLYATIPQQIIFAIKKSRLDLLEKALEEASLTNKQVRKCQILADKILRDRENKYNKKTISSKAIIPRGNGYKLLSGIGVFLSLQLFNAFYQLCEEYKSPVHLTGFFLIMVFIEFLMIHSIKKAWHCIEGEL